MHSYLIQAGKIAVSKTPALEKRNFILGCIGVRWDGAIVSTKNGAVISSAFENYRIISDAHAEARCLKKMGRGGTLYVARVLKKNGEYAMSRPCGGCQIQIRAAKIKEVYYTIDQFHYGVWNVEKDVDKIYDC